MSPRTAPTAMASGCAVLLLAGCAGTGGGASTTPVSSHSPTRVVHVGLTEWTISQSEQRVPAGRVRLVVTNVGGTEHDLAVTEGSHQWSTPQLAPGRRAVLVVRALRGRTLHLSSQVPGQVHPMNATLTPPR